MSYKITPDYNLSKILEALIAELVRRKIIDSGTAHYVIEKGKPTKDSE